MTADQPLVLGIETSCDETGVGIVRGGTLLVDAVASSVDEHARFGGVVPEVASRAHLEAMVPTIERACRESGVRLEDLDAIAVTAGPGLAGALLVGVAAAKALAVGARRKPLYGVNHLASHVAVDVVEHGPAARAVSGAAGQRRPLLVAAGPRRHRGRAAARRDDRRRGGGGVRQGGAGARAALPRRSVHRPGGAPGRAGSPSTSRAGLTGGRDLERHRFDFSFSGLKTAVSRWVAAARAGGRRRCRSPTWRPSFQEAVVDVLTRKAVAACRSEGVEDLLIGGGVAANSRLRALAQERCDAAGIRLRVPRPGLCTDNGAMVAALGAQMVARGVAPSALDLPADSSMPVTLVRA